MDSHLGLWVIQYSMPVFCIFILVEGDNKVYCGILQTFASLILKTEPQNIYDVQTDFFAELMFCKYWRNARLEGSCVISCGIIQNAAWLGELKSNSHDPFTSGLQVVDEKIKGQLINNGQNAAGDIFVFSVHPFCSFFAHTISIPSVRIHPPSGTQILHSPPERPHLSKPSHLQPQPNPTHWHTWYLSGTPGTPWV